MEIQNQHMSNIQGVRAHQGRVILDVYYKGINKDLTLDLGAPVRQTSLMPDEAEARAEAMVAIASKLPRTEDRKVILDVVKEMIIRIAEAREQLRKMESDRK